MRSLGRFLQLVGLVVLPAGMVLQLSGAISPGIMLRFMIAGALMFGIGWILMTYR